jgi:hypothetical protein
MITALSPNYKIRVWGIGDNLNDVLSQSDCVAFPGGIGDSDSFYRFFKRRHGNATRAVHFRWLEARWDLYGSVLGRDLEYFDLLRGIDMTSSISNNQIQKSKGRMRQLPK